MPQVHSRREQALLATDISRGAYFFLDLRTRAVGPVRVAFGGRERCDDGYRVERAGYPFATLEYVAEGLGRIQFGTGSWHELKAGTIFSHGPTVDLRMETAGGSTLVKYFICFSGRGARALLATHASTAGTLLQLTGHGELRETFDAMIREGAERNSFTHDICNHLSRVLLLKISQVRQQRSKDRPSLARDRFMRLKAMMDDRGSRFRSIKEMATALHLESSGLNRLFRRYQGVSPYQYLLRQKMNLAAQDLIHTGGLVKEVAERAGFPDPYHFSRVFKAIHGVSPAHFLRRAESS